MAFSCTKCGACCRVVGLAIQAVNKRPESSLSIEERLFKDFPYPVSDQGVCSQYDPEVGCKVYAERPLVCSMDKVYEAFYRHKTREEFDRLNVMMCGVWIDHLGIDPALKPV